MVPFPKLICWSSSFYVPNFLDFCLKTLTRQRIWHSFKWKTFEFHDNLILLFLLAQCSRITRHHIVLHTIRWLTTYLESSTNTTEHRMSVYGTSRILPSDATPETMYLAVKVSRCSVLFLVPNNFVVCPTYIPYRVNNGL